MAFKRIVTISDLHCGHRVGLTPPDFNQKPINDDGEKWHIQRKEQWNWFARKIHQLRKEHPIDIMFVVGDAVDGPSERACGRDCIWPKPEDQIAIATACLQFVEAGQIRMVYGTRSHVANCEQAIAANLDAPIEPHPFPQVYKTVFDLKHKIGSSSSPTGRAGSLLKARVWNALQAEVGNQPTADVMLRAHVHYHAGTSGVGARGIWHIYTLPALQGPGSEFGLEQCEGIVDYGFMHFDVYDNGHCEHQVHLAKLDSHKAVPVVC